MARKKGPGRIRRAARAAAASAPVQAVVSRSRRVYRAVAPKVQRVYVGGKRAYGRASAAIARSRANGILSGTFGKLLGVAATVGAMVLLIPIITKVFKVTTPWKQALIFGALGVLFLVVLRRPGLAIGAASVAGFLMAGDLFARVAPQLALGSGATPAPALPPAAAQPGTRPQVTVNPRPAAR